MKYTLILLFLVTTTSLSLGSFKNGLLIDPDTNKPYTGNLEIINVDWGTGLVEFSKDYKKGVLHGLEKTYYKSGVLKSVGKFNHGLLDGDVTGYYENGSVRVVGHFYNGIKDGKKEGLWKTWYENGNVMKEEPYKDDLLHGYLKTYYESGGIFEKIKYDYGTPKILIRYKEDGTIFDQKGFITDDSVKGVLI